MDHASTSSTTLDAWVEDFLTAKAGAALSPASLRTYRQRLYLFRAWFVQRERPLDRATLRAYLAYLQRERADGQRLSPTTVASYFRDVTIFLNWLAEEELLDGNPARKLGPKLPKCRPASYSLRHLQRLLAVCDPRDRALIVTLLDTGLRASELVQLERDSIDWATGAFTVIGKGNKERAAWLSDVALTTIRAYLDTRQDAAPALWLGRWGPLTANGVHQAVQRRAQQAGIRSEVRRLLHSFRATFAKHYVMRGGDLESLRELLGHTTIAMAAHYAQLADDELARKKAAVNPLALVFPLQEE